MTPRPFPLALALLGFASTAALAQEALPPEQVNPAPAPTATEPKPVKKTAGAAPRRFASAKPPVDPTPAPIAAGGSSKSRRVAFVEKRSEAAGETASEVQEERPLSFWERLFGRRKPKATPAPLTPVPAATPKATPRRKSTTTKPVSTTGSGSSNNAGTTTKPKVKEASTTEPPAAIAENTKPAAAKATPAPAKKPAPTASTAPVPPPVRKVIVPPPPDADAEVQEKHRYEVAKDKALQDPEVLKLKEKADGASSDEEARKAQRAYNKALFGKMRSIDSSIKDRADRIEAAILKRLESAE